MGFREDIERISKYLPDAPERQTFLFSATVSRAIQDISKKLLSPKHTFVNCVSESDTATHAHIPQYTTVLPSGADAMPHLLRLITHDQLLCAQEGRKSKVMVFLSTTKMTQMVADVLAAAAATSTPRRGRGAVTSPILFPMATRTYEMHAKRDMSRRIAVSASFRADVNVNSASVLVTSDVSARGVDYPGVTRVIQFGVPGSPDMYVHRVGRTGRGGDKGGKGRADLIVADWEAPAVARIARAVGVQATSLSVNQVERECREMIAASGGTYSEANLGEIAPWSETLMQRVGHPDYVPPGSRAELGYPNRTSSEMVSSTFLSQLGFYLGRAATTGLASQAVASGLQKFFGDMCALTRDLHISQTLLSAMRNGGGLGGRGGDRGGFDRRESSSRGGGGGGSSWGGSSWGDSRGASRGSEGREGYRQRSNGSSGYTASAPPRRQGSWEGSTGRGGSSRPAYGGRGDSKPAWSGRGSQRGGQGSEGGYASPRAVRGAPPLFYGSGTSAAPERTAGFGRGRGGYSSDEY